MALRAYWRRIGQRLVYAPLVDHADHGIEHRNPIALRLHPWEMPPCLGDLDNGSGRDEQAWALLKRMRKVGVSRWHPSPLEACQKAEAALKMNAFTASTRRP